VIIALESRKTGSKVNITDSEGYSVTSKDPSDLFEVLTYPYDDAIKVVWDMEAFLKPILALMPKEVRQSLTNGEKAFYNATKLFWGVGKGQMFGVNYKRHIRDNFYEEGQDETIYQLKTFFPNETVSSIADVKVKGKILMSTLKEMGLKPSRLTSCASIVSETILNKMSLPTIYDMPDEALECAEWSANYIREWRSTYKIGIFNEGEIFDFDKTAAYSSIMTQLPNLKYADYVRTDGEIPDSYWGILHGEVTINKEVSPIIHADGKAYKGTYEDLITTDDLECIRKWGIGDFKADSGWFVRLRKKAYPFDYIMRKFYSFRGNNDIKDYLAKQMVNTIWGKMAERHGSQFGEFYFPIYSCMTTSKMRCALCDFIYGNKLESDLVSVIVDGLLGTKKVPNVSEHKRFGEWRINTESPAIVLSSPMQWVGDKRQCGVDVYQMLNEIKSHPMKTAWNGAALRFLEQDRYFEELPKHGIDLLKKVYDSTAFNVESSNTGISNIPTNG